MPISSILIVDDDEANLVVLEEFLMDDYDVVACASADDALSILRDRPFDLIISDVNMPNLDGFKLAEMKAKKGIDTPVIFLTALSGGEDEARGLRLGAADYLTKPIRKEVFLIRVARVLGAAN